MKLNNFLTTFIKYSLFSALFTASVTALPINILPHSRIDTAFDSSIKYTPRDINILSVGDWGSAALGGYHLRNAVNTADAMKIYASEYKPRALNAL